MYLVPISIHARSLDFFEDFFRIVEELYDLDENDDFNDPYIEIYKYKKSNNDSSFKNKNNDNNKSVSSDTEEDLSNRMIKFDKLNKKNQTKTKLEYNPLDIVIVVDGEDKDEEIVYLKTTNKKLFGFKLNDPAYLMYCDPAIVKPTNKRLEVIER